jgi:glycosyltransferase involved in cell wall biosynthesis
MLIANIKALIYPKGRVQAKVRNKKIAFYLVNGNYHGSEWHQDLDAIFTDSKATANLYKSRADIHPIPLGTFIDKTKITPTRTERRHVTFVNPSRAKGSLLVAQLAIALETRRPDIIFEVVEGRSPWIDSLMAVSRTLGCERTSLRNVLVTAMTRDMGAVYGRSRIVLAPSLGWESGSRVLAEASLNGVPTIVSARGGSPEMIGAGGITLTLPEVMHAVPYDQILAKTGIETIAGIIERLYDDLAYYQDLVQRTKQHADQCHNIEKNADALHQRFEDLIAQPNI